jgi:23S rRNA pseudouridine1911/1915/1917 synthase
MSSRSSVRPPQHAEPAVPAGAAARRHELTIPAGLSGRRLDQALAELLPEYSRSRLKEWIEAGVVRVDGRAARPRDRLAGTERVVLEATLAARVAVLPQAIALEVLHEDAGLMIVNKPAGLVVHPGAGNPDRTLQNALLAREPALAALPRAGIVHRLDKDTSGLLLVARTLGVHTALVRMLQARDVHREYQAVCAGVMTAGGTVEAAIGRHRSDRLRMAVRSDGRAAVTHYRVLRRYRAHTHLRVQLETGRTHQIRVHLAHIGFPIVGDPVYGRRLAVPAGATPALAAALRGLSRQALHAARLELLHPQTGIPLVVEAPLPADLCALLQALDEDLQEHRRAGSRHG